MTLSIYAGQDITPAFLQRIAPLGAVKIADESVTSSITLQNDDTLSVSLEANSTYLFVCYIDYEGGTQGSSDLKWAWSIPSGMTGSYGATYTGTAGGQNTGQVQTSFTATTAAGTNGAGNHRSVTMIGSVTTSSAGTLQLQWAQNTSNATATKVHAGSVLVLWKMS